jgi:hypothetical protein
MAKDRLYVRMDRALKNAAQKYADAHFLDLTAVITQALVELLRKHGYMPKRKE